MAEVFSVRANEEIQQRFRDLVNKSGLTQNDFMNTVLTMYAAREVTERVPFLAGAIEAIEDQTVGAVNILIGVGEMVQKSQDKALAELEAKKADMEHRIAKAETESTEAKDLLADLQKQFDKKVLELAESVDHERQLERILDDKTAIIDSNREKIESLELVIARQRKGVEDAELALADNAALRGQVKAQDLRIHHLEAEKKEIEAEKLKAEAEKSQALTELEASLRKEMAEQLAEREKTHNEYLASLRKEMQERRAEREQAFKDYEARTNASMERETQLQGQIRDLQAAADSKQAEIAALKANAPQDKPAAKARAQRGTEGPMETGRLKQLMEGESATPLDNNINTDEN